MTKRFLTPRETSEYLTLNLKTIYSLAARGLLPVVRFGRQLRVDLTRLNQYIDTQCPAVPVNARCVPSRRAPGPSGIHEGKQSEKGQT